MESYPLKKATGNFKRPSKRWRAFPASLPIFVNILCIMQTNRIVSVVSVFFLFLISGLASAETANVTLESADCPVSIQFNGQSGMINGLSYKGESISVLNPDAVQFDYQVGDDWIVFNAERTLEKFDRPDGNTLVVSQRVGDWRVESTFSLIPGQAMFKRSMRLTYLGTEPEVRLKAYWEAYPALKADENAALFMPGNYPPRLVKAADLDLNKVTGFGDNSALVCQVRSTVENPLSVLFLYDNNDPNADRSGYEANRMETGNPNESGLRVKQVFQMKARMKPGDAQTLGTSYVWVLQQDRESAMKRIHDWQAMVGLVVPSDRPDWFQSAALYAFHPGGTIGSDMKDWGGFKAAQTVLPRIRSMNVNALWILPIEDKSIYWPRDYYKLQDGLGTPDDYRDLVRAAHLWNMNVLQDCVPHGGSNYFPRAKEHPEWLAYKEDGSTFDYWCFDFNWPTWRQYMADVVKYYMSRYDVDGYRVDAVGGSRTPNWSADLPYPRASFSQSQGGVNMLRSLRSSVKTLKPEKAGLLAEVQGSRYGAVADAVYDFTGCYSAFQAIRTQEPADFVKTLRRWLYESQYGEIKGLLRLRHIESHDSLRSQGWYGPEPMRALFALTCFIDGIPLLYQEQDVGNLTAFSQIIKTRDQLTELQGGDADYMSVNVPDGVFACLRTKGENKSIVLINFNYEPVEFDFNASQYLTIDESFLTFPYFASCRWNQEGPKTTCRIKLKPYNYLVLAAGKRDPRTYHAFPPITDSTPITSEERSGSAADVLTLSSSSISIDVSRKTGLIERVLSGEKQEIAALNGDLILPAEYVGDPDKVKVSTNEIQDEKGCRQIVVRREYPTGTLILTYRTSPLDKTAMPSGFVPVSEPLLQTNIETRFEGEKPEYAALTFQFNQATIWAANTVEGWLADYYFARPEAGKPGTSSIYWRTQGTNVLFDSLFHPIDAHKSLQISWVPGPAENKWLNPRKLEIGFYDPDRVPPRVQLLGRTENAQKTSQRLTANFWLIDQETPGTKNEGNNCISLFGVAQELLQARLKTPSLKRPSDLKAVAGGYLYENDFYRIRLGRGGAMTGLWSKDAQTGELKKIVDQGQLYTDYGWGEKGLRYSNQNEVEAAAHIEPLGDGGCRLIFQGRLRGKGRFEKTWRPVEYTTEYRLAKDSPTFGLRCAIDVERGSSQETGFLSLFLPIPDMDSCVWQTAEPSREIVCRNRETKGRCWQSLSEQTIPASGAFKSKDATLLSVSVINAYNVKNLFVDGQNLFFAFADSTPLDQIQSGSFEAQFTVGNRQAVPVQELETTDRAATADQTATSGGAIPAPILKNGDFERTLSGHFSARYGAIESTAPGARPLDGWSVPDSACSCGANPKSGEFCLEVENSSGEYLLASQVLPMDRLPAGSRWKVRGFVRGESIKLGDISWKVGCLRLSATVDGKTVYFSSPSYLGSFDWRPVEFDVTIPENCSGVSIQAGLNGATGKIWFDAISIVSAGK